MKTISLLFGATLAVAGCATAPAVQPVQSAPPAQPAQTSAVKETPASQLVDHAGDSVETAVEVPADAPEEGVPFQNDWIYDRIGRFRRTGGGTGQTQGRRYDIVEVETPMGAHYKFFFDITENWKRWKPSQP